MMKYRHPYDETIITDKTELPQELNTNNGAALLASFVCDKGQDGIIRTFKDLKSLRKEHGNPDFRKHGQAYLQVVNWLANGGIVHGLRITADDASYSNLLISLKISVTKEPKLNEQGQPLYTTASGEIVTESSGNTPITVDKAKVQLVGSHFSNLNDITPEHIQEQLKSKELDESGTVTIPLWLASVKGRGIYGDSYRIRMTPNSIADRGTDYRNYTFELYLNEGGISKEDPLNVSPFPNALDSYRRSEFIDDVIKKNIYPIVLYSYESAFDKITAKLLPILQQELPEAKAEEIDFIFGMSKSGVKYKNIVIDDSLVALTALEGVGLSNGSDGSFAMSNSGRTQSIHAKYVKAYNGDIDRAIYNTKKFPTDIMLDANLPIEVKKAMQVCRAKRNDCPLILDAGILGTLSASKSWRKSEMPVDDYAVQVSFQHFTTFDDYTSKEIKVTALPYLFSILLPRHFANVGNHKPMAGSNYPIRDIIIKDSLKPTVIENEDKNDLYDMRLNYIEEDTDSYILATQLTSQNKNSELTNLNNIFVLYEMKKVIERLVPQFRYEFTESDDDLANFNRRANQSLQIFQDYKCKAVKVDISQSQSQKERKILQTKLAIWYKSFSERNLILMDIER